MAKQDFGSRTATPPHTTAPYTHAAHYSPPGILEYFVVYDFSFEYVNDLNNGLNKWQLVQLCLSAKVKLCIAGAVIMFLHVSPDGKNTVKR